MDESDSEDNKAVSSLFSRLRKFRSPSFRKNEVKALLQLLEANKFAILNKSTNSAANTAKEKAWKRVAHDFNKQGLGPKRTAEMLRTKWENLKRNARRYSKDVMDDDLDSGDDIKKTVMMLCTAENIGFDEVNNSCHFEDDGADFGPSGSEEEDNSTFVHDADGNRNQNKSTKCYVPMATFSPHDCKVLLQCVRQEKKVLFSKTSLVKRQAAWKRVADAYNNQSAGKKTAQELSRKFNNMKFMARKINFKGIFRNKKRKKYQQLDADMVPFAEKIKSEPVLDCSADVVDIDSDDEQVLDNPVDNFRNSHPLRYAQDPLNNAHSSDSGLGSFPETKDVARLKVELLNYKIETARLERKRVEDLMKGDEREREMRAAELTLRLRAARLAVVAEEGKLPATHPALVYTAEEKQAQLHLSQASFV